MYIDPTVSKHMCCRTKTMSNYTTHVTNCIYNNDQLLYTQPPTSVNQLQYNKIQFYYIAIVHVQDDDIIGPWS